MTNHQSNSQVHSFLLYLFAIGVICVVAALVLEPIALEIGADISRWGIQFVETLLNSGTLGTLLAQAMLPNIDHLQLTALKRQLVQNNPSIGDHLHFIGQLLRPLFSLLLVSCVVSIWRLHQPGRMKRQFGIDKLAKQAMQFNPALRPVLAANLLTKNPDQGQLRRDDSPIRTAIIHELIKVYGTDTYGDLDVTTLLTPTFDKSKGKSDGYVYVEDDLDKGISQLHGRCVIQSEPLAQYFIQQLGAPIKNIEGLSAIESAFLAICLPMIHGDKSTTFDLIDRLNQSFNGRQAKKGVLDWLPNPEISKIINRYKDSSEIVEQLFLQHEYPHTLLTAALVLARKKGKLPTDTLMYWIKWYDRTLWYSINMTGSPTAWMSTAAIRSTYSMEKKLGRKITQPFIETAVSAFWEFMDETEGWLYDEEQRG